MTSHWITQKGDEWHFCHKHFQASADFYSKDDHLDIRNLKCTKKYLKNRAIMWFIKHTKEKFQVGSIGIRLDSPEISDLLNNLKRKNKITFVVVNTQRNRIGESALIKLKLR